jgi:hypothetical protein
MRSMRIATLGHPYTEFPEGRDDQETRNEAFSRTSDAGISLYFAFVTTRERLLWASKLVLVLIFTIGTIALREPRAYP